MARVCGRPTAAWGDATIRVDDIDQPLRLQGQQVDEETGFHYNRFRYYDPQAGCYLSPDPIGLAGGEHAYLYCNGDPINTVDPLGLAVTDPLAVAEYEAYKKRCSESPPPGLDECEETLPISAQHRLSQHASGMGRQMDAGAPRPGHQRTKHRN